MLHGHSQATPYYKRCKKALLKDNNKHITRTAFVLQFMLAIKNDVCSNNQEIDKSATGEIQLK